MTWVPRMQILMLASYVICSSAILVLFWPLAPLANLLICIGIGALVTVWSGVMIVRQTQQSRQQGALLLLDDATIWLGTLSIGGTLWLLFPFGDPTMLAVYVVMGMTAIAGIMIGSISKPPDYQFVIFSPLALPAAFILYFIVYQPRFFWIFIWIMISFSAAFLMAKRELQAIMMDAWHARRAAEDALSAVAAERDAKFQFLAAASHDLGQPLQAAQMFFEQAVQHPEAERRDRAAQKVRWAFESMSQQVQRIGEYLRLESGGMTAAISRFEIGPVIARVVALNEAAARIANVEINTLATRKWVNADPVLVERAIGNLIDNALRHSKASRILVGVRPRGDRLRIWVIDNGNGIAPADLDRIFEDYTRGSDHRDDIRGGFGLGLSSTRRLALLNHGSVGVNPLWTGGSAFWLELPCT
jgi:signal transduction histidine kinase